MTAQLDTTARLALISGDRKRARAVSAMVDAEFDVVCCMTSDAGSDVADLVPDLILIDTEAGGDVTIDVQALRRDARVEAVPIAVLAEAYDPDAEARALAAGASDYVVRTVRAPVLCARLRTRIESQRYRRSMASSTALGATAAEELRVSEARFRAFFDNSPHAMSIQDPDGRYLEDSGGARRLYGHGIEVIGGKLPHEVWTAEIADKVEAANRQVRETGAPVHYDNEVLVGDKRKWVRVAKFPIIDSAGNFLGIGSIGTDLSEWKNADRKLRESRRRFRHFAESSSDWFWEMGADLRVTSITEQGARSLDAAAIEGFNAILARDGPERPATERADAWTRFRQQLEAHEPIRDFELPLRDPSRGMRYIRVSGRVLRDDDGAFVGYRGVGTDITDVVLSWRQARMLRAAINASSDATVLYDENRCVVFSSRRFHEIFNVLPSQRDIPGMQREALARIIAEGGALGARIRSTADVERYVAETTMLTTDIVPGGDERTYANGRTYLRRYEDAGEGGLLLQLHDITDIKRAQRELEAYQAELRRLASEVSLAEERERRRIATELHDGAVQNLGLARMRIGALMRKHDQPGFGAELEGLRHLIAQSVRELRSLMSELSPPMLYEFGLSPALEWLVKHFEAHHALACTMSAPESPSRLPTDLTVLLFQAVRELLMNVVKHAHAERAEVELRDTDQHVELRVRDDGVGIDPERLRSRHSHTGGFGLFSVRERVELIGGSVLIEATAPGTVITIRAPRDAG